MLRTLFKNKAITDGSEYSDSIIVDEVNRLIFQVDHTTAVTELAGLTLSLSTQDETICRRIPLSVLHEIAKQNGSTTGDATESIFSVGIGALYLDDDEELTYLIENSSGETQTVDLTLEYNLNNAPSVLIYSKRTDTNFAVKTCELIALTGSAMDEATSVISVTTSKGETSLPVLGYNAVMNCDGPYDSKVKTFTILYEGNQPDDVIVEASDLSIGSNFFLIVQTQDNAPKMAKAVMKASKLANRAQANLPSVSRRISRIRGN